MSSVSIDVANQLRFANTYGTGGARITGQSQYTPAIAPQEPEADNYNGKKAKGKGKKSKIDYSIDDGKISFGDKMKNFAKGVVSPITSMFKSPKNFLIGAATIAAGAALIVATSGVAAPVLVALGVTGGGLKFASSAIKAGRAKTDEDARKAWRGMGAGVGTVAGSVAGAKPALRAVGVETEGMSALNATINCFRLTPCLIRGSFQAFTSGEALNNLRNFFNRNQADYLDDDFDHFFDDDFVCEGGEGVEPPFGEAPDIETIIPED